MLRKKVNTRAYGGLGIAIVSTPKGMMTGHKPGKQGIGGNFFDTYGK